MKYELTFIISATIPETDHQKVEAEILSYLKKIDAKIIKEPYSIGRKKLAYSIQKQKYGFYTVIEFTLEDTNKLKELDTEIKYNNNILRHLIIKIEKRKEEVKKEEPKVEEEKEEIKKEEPKAEEEKEEIKVEEPKVEEEKEDIELNLDDIDKKLDDILKE